MNSNKSNFSIVEQLTKLATELTYIKKRLYFLEAIIEQFKLHDTAKIGTVMVRNHIVYDIVRDCFEMLIIDLASFCKHFIEKKGFLLCIRANLNQIIPNPDKPRGLQKTLHFSNPGSQSLQHTTREMDIALQEHSQELLKEDVKASIKYLFPNWQGAKISTTDLDSLRDNFEKIVSNLRADRDNIRAHKFEKKSQKSQINPIDLGEIRTCFREAEKILETLTFICKHANLNLDRDLNPSETSTTARDIADIILNGSVNQLLNNMNLSEIHCKNGETFRFYYLYRDNVSPALDQT